MSERARPAMRLAWKLLPWVVIAIAILFRVLELGRLPGINGDEAWYGVQAQRWASGEMVDWRTPSGNLPGPLQLGGLLLLQAVFEPSFALLRVPSLIASLGAMAMAYAIGRRFFDRTTAMIALLLMAALPVNIAYARFGWDTSHLGLVILAAAYAALAGRRVLSALAFGLSVTVHPTAVFAGPFLALLVFGREMETVPLRPAIARLLPYLAMLILASGLLAITTSGGQALASFSGLGDRLTAPAQWAAFGILFERLMTGETVYRYITGQGFGRLTPSIDLAGAVLIMGLAASAIITLRRRAFGIAAGVVTGWLLSLLLFFLIAGNGALQPHFERYALWLIAPTSLAVAVLVRRLVRRDNVAITITLAITILLLAGFWLRYFVVLETQGSLSSRTFWTGPAEPKQAAHDQLAAVARAEGPIRVVAEDWWLFWPVRYLAGGEPIKMRNAESLPPRPDRIAQREEIYWLVYTGSALDRQIAATADARLRSAIDATGHPQALHIWWTPAKPTSPRAQEQPSAPARR